MTPRYCRVPGCDHDPANSTCGPYLPPLREGELQRYAERIPPGQFEVPDGGLSAIEALRQQRNQGRAAFEAMAKPPTERGWTMRVTRFGRVSHGRIVDLDTHETDLTFENEVRPR